MPCVWPEEAAAELALTTESRGLSWMPVTKRHPVRGREVFPDNPAGINDVEVGRCRELSQLNASFILLDIDDLRKLAEGSHVLLALADDVRLPRSGKMEGGLHRTCRRPR